MLDGILCMYVCICLYPLDSFESSMVYGLRTKIHQRVETLLHNKSQSDDVPSS